MRKITINDIAKELGVSASTVSRALRDSYEISTATKKKIMAYAKQANYHPNPHAISLRERKSKTIAVVIPDISNYFFTQALYGIEQVALSNQYHVLVYQTHDQLQTEIEFFNHFQNGRVDGVLVSPANNPDRSFEHIERMSEMIPVVCFDRVEPSLQMPYVTCNDYDSSFKATEQLIKKGCKRIFFIGISDIIPVIKLRLNGYKDALKKHGMPILQEDIVMCDAAQLLAERVRWLLAKPTRPDGLVSAVERYTFTVYDVCNELQLKIPTHLRIISFSNTPYAHLLNPSLSTVVLPAGEVGKSASEILFRKINKKDTKFESSNITLNCVLTFRGSSA
ncbi:MAG: LacI family DNA-binding transcriptional regulator [Bacteroidota bacterium]|nr:LacI family DNA-binding transcriptional regulator [Bacteroidota bacterium]